MTKISEPITPPGSLAILKDQCSHVLFVLTNAVSGREDAFASWFGGACRDTILAQPGVLHASQYEQDDVDITGGQFPAPPFRYVAICELSIDGAEQAGEIIAAIHALFEGSDCAAAAATWLYYPVGRPVGISAAAATMVTLAFANGLPGTDDDFREWYVTRHIRHALNIPTLTSGQCFERTRYQRHGAVEPAFHIIAVYEQTGSSEAIIEAFGRLAPETIAFPALDLSRFGEAAYRRTT